MEESKVDLLVIGSGAAGLTTALTGALYGLSVCVLEHDDFIGGTSARSSGTVWVPDSHLMREAEISGDRPQAEAYLGSLSGDISPDALWRVFLREAPAMLLDLERQAGIAFRSYLSAPDYRQDKPGAAPGGRPLEPLPFDGRELGAEFERLALPLPELMLLGGLMVTRGEAATLLKADRSLSAASLGLRLVGRYLRDRLRYRRGTRLVLGNALVARLLKAALDRHVRVLTGITVERLAKQDGRIVGAQCRQGTDSLFISASRGVVLAGGGFPANPALRAAQLPRPTPEYTPATSGCDGSSIALGLAAGGVLGPSGKDNALWFPSSVMRRPDGSVAVYPHIVLDRAKPGLIAVNRGGERFTNEAASYHQFVRAMYAAHATGSESIPAWLICDRDFIRRYGLGLVRPRTPWLGRYIRRGYLKTGRTIAELARVIGVPADQLVATIERANGFAATGVDADFGKGDNLYDRSNGDPTVSPNPCLGTIAEAPFFAVAVYPTPLGTSRGLSANASAQVLGEDGGAIPGLYVCGNDMHPAFQGEYPGAGAQLGQAMVFGWIAARHAAEQPGY